MRDLDTLTAGNANDTPEPTRPSEARPSISASTSTPPGPTANDLAHDINNLLTVIRGRVELVTSDEPLSSRAAQYLAQVMDAADRAAQLGRQLVAVCRTRPKPDSVEVKSSGLTAAAASSPRGGSEKVLVIEKDQGLRKFVCLLLQRLGYAVSEAASVSEALGTTTRAVSELDLVITSANNGALNLELEAVRQLRQTKPRLKAIIVSSSPADEKDATYAADDALVVLSKPFTPEKLAQTVRDCLDRA